MTLNHGTRRAVPHRWLSSARAFIREDAGPTATEYAVLLALIVVVSMGMITSLGNRHADIWHAIADATQQGTGGTP